MIMKNKDVIIKKSKIAGRGLYANRDFKKGENIVIYDGEKVTKKVGDDRFEEQQKKGLFYVFLLNRKFDIDGEKGTFGKYANHSCNPNAESVNYDGKEIWLEAKKNIKKGEEITYNYNLTGDEPFECKCGNDKCTGKI